MSQLMKFQYESEDYAQSANTLFHFMKKPGYLADALSRKALLPRYCKENISYLNITDGEAGFDEIYVLQKCFCDIPLHKITENLRLKGVGDTFEQLSSSQREALERNNTHPDFYGKYAIAFSKGWGEKNNLQPIHYLNENSAFTKDFTDVFDTALEEEDISDKYADSLINRLCFSKPLRGVMKRKIQLDEEELEIEFLKNFHDEKEWRYIPDQRSLQKAGKDALIANPYAIELNDVNQDFMNRCISEKDCELLWLKFRYDEIRYLIVPDSNARLELIGIIQDLPKENFDQNQDIQLQKMILISKILLLDEIRKDI